MGFCLERSLTWTLNDLSPQLFVWARMHVCVTEIVAETFIGHDVRPPEALEITLGHTMDFWLAEAWANVGIHSCLHVSAQ